MITRYLPFVLRLDAPLIAAGLESDPNSVESMTFVPGSALRGAAARALCVRGVDRERPDDFRRLILSGQVRYLNAYLGVGGGRSLPVPASLRRAKHGDTAFDLAGLAGHPEASLTRLDVEFVSADADDFVGVTVATSGHTHQQRDRRAGRPTASTGALCHFESVDADQEFHGLLVVTGPDEDAVSRDVTTLKEALGDVVLLGRSRRAGYGGAAKLTWLPERQRESEGRRVVTEDLSPDATVRVLLTSDYIGRHPTSGQIDPTAFGIELRRRLGDRVEVVHRFQDFRTVGGYNRTWGLELPQGLALRAGSVFVARVTQPIPLADLLTVEHGGFGERRAEGFGRVLFLRPADATVTPRAAERVTVVKPDGTPPPLLQTLQRRLLEDAVEQRIAETAARLAESATDLPSRSLLNQLRLPLRRPPRDALGEFQAWLEKLRSPAKHALEGCRLRDGRFRDSLRWWLIQRAGEGDLANLLGYDDLAKRYHFGSVEAARATLDNPGFANRTRIRLLDAVLAALARSAG